jgi:hypothetical protein
VSRQPEFGSAQVSEQQVLRLARPMLDERIRFLKDKAWGHILPAMPRTTSR